jgi:hypothetical protein
MPTARALRRLLVVVPLTVQLAACSGSVPLNRQTVAPDQVRSIDPQSSRYLKAHMKDGRVYVLVEWKVDEAARVVTGFGRLLEVDRARERVGPWTVRIDDAALFESNEPSPSPGLAGLLVVTGASLVVTAACLTNPKACFGSCPTFYVSDGQRPVLQAEGFSDSIAPSLEATDVDALYRARPRQRALQVRMTNEALETHVVKAVEVLAVARPAGGRVFHATRGPAESRADDGFYGATALRAPASCRAPEGDCTQALRAFDARERSSLADESNLAAREELTLEFPPSGASSLGLVIAARQTLLTTFLLYQGLAYLGSKATEALSQLERDPALKANVAASLAVLGGIDVLVPDARGQWRQVGGAFETGPLAVDTHLVRIPAPPSGPVRVRLRMAKGDWRLDWVALAELGPRLQPTRLAPRAIAGRTAAGGAVTPRLGETIVTQPGDAYTFDFQLPESPEAHELFLSSRGYYLEWIRQSWLKDESGLRAAMMLYTPSVALRVLAPAYKRQEAGMERIFWESRFAVP